MRHKLIIACVLVIVLCIVVAMTTVNRRFIDVNSAMLLEETSIAGIRIKSAIRETEFSKILRNQSASIFPEPRWVITDEIHPFLRPYSPHFYMHGVPQSLKAAANKIGEMSNNEAKKDLMSKIVDALQQEDGGKIEDLSY